MALKETLCIPVPEASYHLGGRYRGFTGYVKASSLAGARTPASRLPDLPDCPVTPCFAAWREELRSICCGTRRHGWRSAGLGCGSRLCLVDRLYRPDAAPHRSRDRRGGERPGRRPDPRHRPWQRRRAKRGRPGRSNGLRLLRAGAGNGPAQPAQPSGGSAAGLPFQRRQVRPGRPLLGRLDAEELQGPRRAAVPARAGSGRRNDGRGFHRAERAGLEPGRDAVYIADSPAGAIFRYGFDSDAGAPNGGVLGQREAAVEPGIAPGWPDGMAVDESGCLWSARWDGGCVVRFTPDGAVDRIVDMPVSRPTSCRLRRPGPRHSGDHVGHCRDGLSSAFQRAAGRRPVRAQPRRQRRAGRDVRGVGPGPSIRGFAATQGEEIF